jgi:quinol monooxygenase YgiN
MAMTLSCDDETIWPCVPNALSPRRVGKVAVSLWESDAEAGTVHANLQLCASSGRRDPNSGRAPLVAATKQEPGALA